MGRLTTPSKFLFDTDFNEPAAPVVEEPSAPEVPMLAVDEHERLLEAARAEAYERGRKAGVEEARSLQETRFAEETSNLVGAVEHLIGQLGEIRDRQEKDAIAFSFLVARRLCAHLIARNPLAETVALVSECLGPLRQAPHVVIRVAERDVEALKAKTDPLVYEKGFEGRLVILGEPDIERGDCRIEWADGGILRDRKAVERQIDQVIRNYFQAKAGARARHAVAEAVEAKDTQA
ncbi:Flagellar assembly protein H [Polymorphum gilvum SL003B-26A1]|uniref:Flagellar assembly protein FliH n=2 Tax=Polymorphum TaxID=991903 RepID=F2IZL7_POLGS|nr:Flagellar assembly protein H [Polymorphum gilvum SL003B-26A1]